MKNLKNLLLIALFFITATVLAQTKIMGTVVDEAGESLPGASVVEKGTSNGTSTDFDGKFALNAKSSNGMITISFVGYTNKTINFTAGGDLGTIQLQPDSNTLDEIVITSGVIDIAKERETPIAVSTISPAEISLKAGNQEFPEIMNKTPSVYATKGSGGYGDGSVTLRGFDQTNTSYLINGQPINDMENGAVFWSNWAGIADIAAGIQIQRGLGASRLAVPSVGGTVSVITRAADEEEGGFLSQVIGNDGYKKVSFNYNTGKSEKGWAFSMLLSGWEGDGYVYNTSGAGLNYFATVAYEPEGSKHKFNASFLGAGQWHHQRDVWVSIRDYTNFGEGTGEVDILQVPDGDGGFDAVAQQVSVGEIDRRWNSNGGTLNGQEYNLRRNFYNKPLGTINWDWDINDTFELNTSVYGSWGRGGGTGPRGGYFRNSTTNVLPFNIDLTQHYLANGNGARDENGFQDFDAVVAENIASTNGYTGEIGNYQGQLIGSNGNTDAEVNRAVLIRRSSVNSHDWYGAISSLDADLGKFSASIGIDVRSYKGYHYRVLNDLLGLDGYYSSGDENTGGKIVNYTQEASPFKDTGLTSAKIDYYNVGNVGWQGLNGLVEYNNDKNFTAVVQAGASNQSFQREDYFNQPGNDPISSRKDILGGYVKGGLNYNINENHNVFGNAGYISRQPNFDAVFPNFGNDIADFLQNEEIISYELGYGYSSNKLKVALNAYATTWGNRFDDVGVTFSEGASVGQNGTAQFRDIAVQHNGIELEGYYRVLDNLKLNFSGSYGDWIYTKNFDALYFNDSQDLVTDSGLTSTLYLEDVKVGDSAQLTASLGLSYDINEYISLDSDFRYSDNLYADFSPTDTEFQESDNQGALKLPSFGLLDLGITGKYTIMGIDTSLRFNMNNVLDTVYIAESNTNVHVSDATNQTYKGIDTSNFVWFGYGRTWNVTLRLRF